MSGIACSSLAQKVLCTSLSAVLMLSFVPVASAAEADAAAPGEPTEQPAAAEQAVQTGQGPKQEASVPQSDPAAQDPAAEQSSESVASDAAAAPEAAAPSAVDPATASASALLQDSIASQRDVSGNFEYSVSQGVATIEEYLGNASTVTVPQTIDGYVVTTLGTYAFQGQNGIRSVSLPESLQRIEGYVFDGCTSLTSITLPVNLTYLGTHAFKNCTALTSVTINSRQLNNYSSGAFENAGTLGSGISVTFGSQCTQVPNYLFDAGSSSPSPYVTSISLPASVTEIGTNAFARVSSLRTVSLASSNVTEIGPNAFQGCNGLTSLSLPDSLRTIGSGVFDGCTSLSSMTLPANLESVGTRAFRNCTALASLTVNSRSLSSMTSSTFENAGSLTSGLTARFGSTCTAVPSYMFSGNASLQRVELGSNVTKIGSYAFNGCIGLRSVNFPVSLQTVDIYAFSGCTALASVDLPRNLTQLNGRAFEDCTGLTSITIASPTLTAGSSCFASAGTLASGIAVELRDSVLKIPSGLFSSSSASTAPNIRSILIPGSVTEIGSNAFRYLSGWTMRGYIGTTAWRYAIENDIPFEALDEGGSSAFTDVRPDAWYYDAVSRAAAAHLIEGYADGTYQPGAVLTRAQAAMILWRFYEPEDAGNYNASLTANRTGMSDVENYQWYTGAANWAVSSNVINGVEANGRRYFDSNGTITREQLCMIIMNASVKFGGGSSANVDMSRFNAMPDAGAVDGWAITAVAWGLNQGVINGVAEPDGLYLRPLAAVDRATMAMVVMNAIDNGVLL